MITKGLSAMKTNGAVATTTGKPAWRKPPLRASLIIPVAALVLAMALLSISVSGTAGATLPSRVAALAKTMALEAEDWPMWGGTPDRNMVSEMAGLPESWDIDTNANIKWTAALGSQSYGNPTVAGGKVFVGTNNEALRDPEEGGDRGVLMAFRESDGEFLWQATTKKHPAGRVHDWPFQGVCSSPLVIGDRLYYVTNRGEVVCLDTEGFRDGENDGPYKGEELSKETDADIVWVFNMIEEVGSFPHNMSSSSPVAYKNLIYVNTSNGQDESHVNVPSPLAPDLIALNRHTGKLAWEDSPVGMKILHGQWSAAAVGEIAGVMQVIMGEGDGWVRSYAALTGKQLWEFDTNPKDAVWPRTRNNVISTPVIYNDRVYIGNGQDPEHGEGVGHFYCIDPTKRGDITESGKVWRFDNIRRTISTAAVDDGIVYVPDFSGFLHALDADSGEEYWVHDTFAAVWGSPLLADGKLYLGDEDGDVVVLKPGKEEVVLAEMNMGSSVYSSPVPADGVLFIAGRNRLFAIERQ
ncbi:MAG: PQQ-binding-like beta-propeller repeat protein [Acidobacteriota bacterium]